MECALAEYRTVTVDMLSGHETDIFGTRAHAGMIDGCPKAKKLFEKSNIRKLILFVTGATPNAARETVRLQSWTQGPLRRRFEGAQMTRISSAIYFKIM